MNRFKYLFFYFFVLFSCISVNSCSSDDSDIDYIDLEGTWIGIYTYYNPASGNKSQYLYLTFNSDGSGSMEYESPVSYAAASFKYKISGDIIRCQGAYMSTNDESVSDFDLTLEFLGDKLYPQGVQFSKFVLSRKGTTTTGDGSEVTDDSDILMNCWRSKDGYTVLDFRTNPMTEYIMSSATSKYYTQEYTCDYKYDSVRKLLTLYTNSMREFAVQTLTDASLVLCNKSTNETFSYTKIDYCPEPTPNNDISSKIIGHHWTDKNSKYILYFGTSGEVDYIERSDTYIGSHGYPVLSAKGTYTFTGDTAKCNFSDVGWEYSSSYPNLFPGWSAGKTNVMYFIFENTYSSSIRVTLPNGKSVYMSPID